MKCIVCKSVDTYTIISDFPGYVAGTEYDIFECENCDCQFISTKDPNPKIYDLIYSNPQAPGYERYFRYAKKIGSLGNPLEFLAKEELTYLPALIELNDKPAKRVLEVGCGLGYLTYAIRKAGHDSFGIDVSQKCINFAKENFGDYFEFVDLAKFSPNEKFDVVIATELIEHVPDPAKLISDFIRLLKKGGRIIITTPNKDFCKKGKVWDTDAPPVHVSWLSKRSIRILAAREKLECEFVDFSSRTGRNENKLASYVKSRINMAPKPFLKSDGTNYADRLGQKYAYKVAKWVLFCTPIRQICGFIADLLTKEYRTMAVIMHKDIKEIAKHRR